MVATLKQGVTISGGTAQDRYWDYALDDVDGGIAGWLIRAEMKNRLNKYRRRLVEKPDALRIVAEGDSWFQHPLVDDLIDEIQRVPDFAVLSLASAGATLDDMIKAGDHVRAVREEKPEVFLLSAGGNDFFGEIKDLLTAWKPKPGTGGEYKPDDYISDKFNTLLGRLRSQLNDLISDVASQRSVKRILLHGYDYVIPVGTGDDRSGIWVGKPMRELKITAEYLQRGIVKRMLDRYMDEVLTMVAKKHTKVRVVDFRGTLTRDFHWFDEIHPHGRHIGKLSKQLIAAIRAD